MALGIQDGRRHVTSSRQIVHLERNMLVRNIYPLSLVVIACYKYSLSWPYSRYTPSLHARKERWEKCRSRDLSGGKQLRKTGNTSESLDGLKNGNNKEIVS